jgi:hypothetical protein
MELNFRDYVEYGQPQKPLNLLPTLAGMGIGGAIGGPGGAFIGGLGTNVAHRLIRHYQQKQNDHSGWVYYDNPDGTIGRRPATSADEEENWSDEDYKAHTDDPNYPFAFWKDNKGNWHRTQKYRGGAYPQGQQKQTQDPWHSVWQQRRHP